MQHQKLATIEDVAALAGVSIATVSRAINEPTKVADATRRRVTEAVAKTGYTTNAMARSLRMRRSNMILILAPDVGDPNFSNILVGLETEASKRGYGVLIGNTQNDPARETDYLRFISSNQADGLILFTGHLPYGFGQESGEARLPPMVAVNEPVANAEVPFVGVDNFEGSRVATEHLIAQGHRHIAFIGHSSTRAVNMLREKGYRAALQAAKIEVDPRMILDGDGTTESGRAAAEHMFVRDVLPSAFLCVNDATALGRDHRAEHPQIRSAARFLDHGIRRYFLCQLRHASPDNDEAAAAEDRRKGDGPAAGAAGRQAARTAGSAAASGADRAELGEPSGARSVGYVPRPRGSRVATLPPHHEGYC